jgi:GT2 family glycosyltransferase
MLFISIVTYNNKVEEIQKVINSCIKYTGSYRIYIIDNSQNDNLKILSNIYNIEYIHNPSNPGFGASHNIALKKSLELNAKYHLVLNPDIYFDSKTIEKIVFYMDLNPQVGNLMPKVLYPNGEDRKSVV